MLRPFVMSVCLPLAATGTGWAQAPQIDVIVDSLPRVVSPLEIVTRHDVATLRFEVSAGAMRSRFMLEGLDGGWLPEEGEMNFTVRFLDGRGDQISQQQFQVKGSSPGWKGDVAISPFLARMELVKVPAGAKTFAVIISSSGPPAAVGIYAVTSVNVSSVPGEARAPRELIANARSAENGALSLWLKSGTHPSMASSSGLDDPGAEPLLIIRDNDTAAHADWETKRDMLPPVQPGETLQLSWKECYSIGTGGFQAEIYPRIPPGRYRLLAETLSIGGTPTGMVSSVGIHVPRPYWKSFWFWILVAGTLGIMAYVIGKRAIRRKINRDIRHAQLISDERLRIARDLHDDLGTRLSHIYMLGSHAGASVSGGEEKSNFKQITEM